MNKNTDSGVVDVNGCEILCGDTVAIPYIDPSGNVHKDTDDYKALVMFKHGAFGFVHNERFRPLMDYLERIGKKYVPNVGEVPELSNQSILRVVK